MILSFLTFLLSHCRYGFLITYKPPPFSNHLIKKSINMIVGNNEIYHVAVVAQLKDVKSLIYEILDRYSKRKDSLTLACLYESSHLP